MSVYDITLTGPVAASSPRPWMQRAHGQCAWPIGDGRDLMSCCAPIATAGRHYCDAHHEAGHEPTDEAYDAEHGADRRVISLDLGSEARADIAEINRALPHLTWTARSMRAQRNRPASLAA